LQNDVNRRNIDQVLLTKKTKDII